MNYPTITELPITMGKVNFMYIYEDETKNKNIEEQTFAVEFQSLQELVALLSSERASFYATIKGAKRVVADSVTLISQSNDGTIKIESLLMED